MNPYASPHSTFAKIQGQSRVVAALVTLAVLALAVTQLRAADVIFGGQLVTSSGWADCRAGVDMPAGGWVALEVRLYGPDGSLLAHDEVFARYRATTALVTPLVGSGTYRCWAHYMTQDGSSSGEDTWYSDVP